MILEAVPVSSPGRFNLADRHEPGALRLRRSPDRQTTSPPRRVTATRPLCRPNGAPLTPANRSRQPGDQGHFTTTGRNRSRLALRPPITLPRVPVSFRLPVVLDLGEVPAAHILLETGQDGSKYVAKMTKWPIVSSLIRCRGYSVQPSGFEHDSREMPEPVSGTLPNRLRYSRAKR